MFKAITQATAVMSLALGATFIAPVERVEARSFGGNDCGGLNQKTCISLNRNKRCDAGLVEKKQSGRNICVKPSAPGDKTGGCGGLNEVTCISPNPARWCDDGLTQVRQKGRNICVEDTMGVDTSKGCGGEGEKSCWSLRASQWCDAGLIYKPGALPGKGRCEAADRDNLIQYTRAVASRFKALGDDNEMTRLRKCLISPGRLIRLKEQMRAENSNGTNSIIRECNVDIEKLQKAATYVLDTSGSSSARNLGALSHTSSDDGGTNLDGKLRLTIEYSAGAAAGSAAAGGTIGYAIPLHKKPLGSRWYKHNDDFDFGIDLGIGADILIGIGFPGIPSGDFAKERGKSGVLSGALALKLGLMTRVTEDGRRPMWAIFGGGGLGVTAAMYDYENEFMRDK
uniref:hypothetical protein n=1 Tax=uncultured Erythrobacter sp. TaxID=263913 RepID=UPI00262572C5|nr:hypothetical protein [uncultured Erythrobacter sp.]